MSRTPPYEGGAWFRADFEAVAAEPRLAQAMQRFEASEEGPAGKDGAAAATQWLREFAIDDRSSVTRILLDEGEAIAYYTLSSGQAPDGSAAAAILHAGSVASDLAIQEGKGLLTLDPYDAATEAMWREWGFELTDTPSPTGGGLMRLYMPLP